MADVEIPRVADGPDTAWSIEDRERVRKRLEARQGLATDAVAYVVVNALLVLVWALSGQGYFWPAWVMGAWGIGLVMHVWDAYLRKDVTEADIDAELGKRTGVGCARPPARR